MAKETFPQSAEDYMELARNIEIPDTESFKELAKDLKLDPQQAWALNRTVCNAVEKIKVMAARIEQRPDTDIREDRANLILDILKSLETELSKGRETLQHIAPPENLGLFGKLLSFQAMVEIDPSLKLEPGLIDFVNEQSALGATVSLLDIERRFEQPKQMLDLQKRPDVLIYLAQKMREQFEIYTSGIVKNTGGAPRNWVREAFMLELANDARWIIGKPPTSTENGRFDKLCTAVFGKVGIETAGMPSAISRLKRDHGHEISFWQTDLIQKDVASNDAER